MKNFVTSDIKLQAFLRTLKPHSFIGVEKTPTKVFFTFNAGTELSLLVDGYYTGKAFTFSPLDFACNLDKAKQLIFQAGSFRQHEGRT